MTGPSFPPGGDDWFEALRTNMDKSWYDAHKAEYKRLWSDPMRAVLDAVGERLAAHYEAPLAPPKVHRIHNDRRFRAGAPYKTHCAGYIGFDAPNDGVMSSAVALHLSYGDQQHVGGGVPMFADAGTLACWRAAVADPTSGAELDALLADAQAAGVRYHALSALKQGPAGLRDHPRVELLKLKGLILIADPPAPTAPDLVERLVGLGARMAPTVRWLAHHVTGPADA